MRYQEIIETISPEARDTFRHGGCIFFAIALHEITGWDVYAQLEWYNERTQEDGGIEHAWVEDPRGRAIDIDGVHSKHSVKKGVVKRLNDSRLDLYRSDEFEEYISWARNLIKDNPERFGIARLAEALFLEEGTDYPAIVTPDGLLRLMQDIHHNKDDFDNGDINHRIWKFKQYHLTELPVADLYSPWDVSRNRAHEYADRMQQGEVPPPIIYDADANVMIDGAHRLKAARLAGKTTIAAYVGQIEDIDPNWDEDELFEEANPLSVKELIRQFGGRPVEFRKLPKTAQQAIRTRAVEHLDPDEKPPKINPRMLFGYVEIPMDVLQQAVLAKLKGEGAPFKTFDEYHQWYISHNDTPRHTEVWPIELDTEYDDQMIEDGSHRFHSYVRNGLKVVPAIYRI